MHSVVSVPFLSLPFIHTHTPNPNPASGGAMWLTSAQRISEQGMAWCRGTSWEQPGVAVQTS